MNISTKVLAIVFMGILASACAPVTPQQQARWNETVPVCYSKSDCDTKWAAARQWVQNNAGYKIQIYADDLIETYNPQQNDPKIAVSVTKNPVAKNNDGEQICTIGITVRCANMFGCIPSKNESILSFNKYVSESEINDKDCYRDFYENTNKPKVGFLSQWYNNKHIVKRVCSDSPARVAGLLPNDVLVEIEGTKITSEQALIESLKNINFEDEVSININRYEVPMTLIAKLPSKDKILEFTQKEEVTPKTPVGLEEKLETLSSLLKKNLINQSEYEEKKKELLSNL